MDDPTLTEFRPTKDVDVIVDVITHSAFDAFESNLRAAGFQHANFEGASRCSWTVEDCRVDIMSIDVKASFMNSRWLPEALASAEATKLMDGTFLQIVSPALFIATKLEAFKDRGKGDYIMSHDLEDIISVVDGRVLIVEDIKSAPAPIRDFICDQIKIFLINPDFQDALSGHLPPISRPRLRQVRQKLEAIAVLNDDLRH